MEPRRDSTARSRQLGDELRAKRKAAEIRSGVLADKLGWSIGKVSKLEAGERGTTEVDVAIYLTHCGVQGEELERLVALSRESGKHIWVQPFGEEPADRTRTLSAEESRAVKIVKYDCVVIPGLLQSPGYIRPVAGTNDITHRIRRQEQYWQGTQPETIFFIEEDVLRKVIGGRALMHDQVMHLLLSHAHIRVIPRGVLAQGSIEGSFTLLDNVDEKPVVYVELKVANIFLEHPDHIAQYQVAVDELFKIALDRGQSRVLLHELADEFGRPREDPDVQGEDLA